MSERASGGRIPAVGIVAIVAVVAVPLLLVLCTFTHRPYEEPLVTRFGQVTDPIRLGWNWHLKWPTPIDSVRLIDRRIRSFRTANIPITLATPGRGQDANEQLQVRVFCHWQVTDARQYFRSLNDDETRAVKTLSAKLTDSLNAEAKDKTIDDFFNLIEDKVKQRNMEIRIRDRINYQSGPEQGKLGIRVASVGFYRISFSPSVFKSICDAMVTEQIQRATAYEKEGDEEAARIRASADAQAAIIVSEATAAAEKITKAGEAEADALYRDAIAQSPELWRFLEALKTGRVALSKDTRIFLGVKDAAWLRALFDPDSFGGPATRPADAP